MNATLAPVDFANATLLETLWEEYRGKMAGYMMLRIRDSMLVEDLVATVYLRAWVAMLNGNGYTTNARGWMYQIARSVMYDHSRSLKRTVSQEVELDAVDFSEEDTGMIVACERVLTHVEDETEQAVLRLWVHGEIDRLPEMQANAMMLRLDGLDISEIAELTGNTAGGIRQINHRAFRHLRESLKEIA
jgi:RNA polymerase sigma factor (sigma-70 family)